MPEWKNSGLFCCGTSGNCTDPCHHTERKTILKGGPDMDCFRDNATPRLFVAIIPDRNVLGQVCERVKPLMKETWARRVRWLPLENIHVTLRFLGDTQKKQYDRLSSELGDMAKGMAGFDLMFSTMICLPTPAKTRVLAASVAPCPELDDVARKVETAAGLSGFEPERKRFLGHLTLGRSKNLDLRRQKPLCDFSNLCMTVNSIDLVQSTLTPKGAVYQSLTTFEFLT